MTKEKMVKRKEKEEKIKINRSKISLKIKMRRLSNPQKIKANHKMLKKDRRKQEKLNLKR